MIPVLFKIGPLSIYSFGLMAALAFLSSLYLMEKAFAQFKINKGYAADIVLSAAIGGILGAKINHLLEHPPETALEIFNRLFSGSGLTWFGGFIGGVLGAYAMSRYRKIPFPKLTDVCAPILWWGYGIGRIGCQLSGDGDYGKPTDLPWGMAYPTGVVPTLDKVHPTPVYETLIALIIFFYLWRHLSWVKSHPGRLFSLYLVTAGVERFLIEFIRRNIPIFMGLTEAQLVSLLLVIVGSIFLAKRSFLMKLSS